ncbi:hypothetical protein EJ07DRAFT_158957 [Lizonia empirigonia]|nr:hypothetical protein EJ07DRAFT_158957 [Lizonia empirigonia]
MSGCFPAGIGYPCLQCSNVTVAISCCPRRHTTQRYREDCPLSGRTKLQRIVLRNEDGWLPQKVERGTSQMESPLPREARTAHQYGRSTRLGAVADRGQEQQLDFRINPLEVRLITGPDEPYTWSYMPDKAHLFPKHLSKHTMVACVELYAEVGKTFEAVLAGAGRATGAPDCLKEVDISFTSTIKQLEQKHALLQQDHIHVVEACERWQAQAMENGQLRASAENELAVKKADLESAHAAVQDLRRQLQVASESFERLQQQRASSIREMDVISRMLNNVKSGLSPAAEPDTV